MNDIDKIFEAMSELKFRIAKLEEYKKLQIDVNVETSKFLNELEDRVKIIEKMNQQCIEANPIKDIYSWFKIYDDKINKYIFDLNDFKNAQVTYNKMTDSELLNLHEHLKKQIDENRAVSKHLTDLEESYQGLSAELRYLLEKPKKTTGLTFEEAILAFKTGKTIKSFEAYEYNISKCTFVINSREILSNDWEIIENN